MTKRVWSGLALSTVIVCVMAAHFLSYLEYAWAALQYPFELDYGEGVVWQQAMLIPGPRMYGDIGQYPFLVFHYPPLYHLAVRALTVVGPGPLLAGRMVALASSLTAGGLVAALAYATAARTTPRWAAAAGGLVGGFSFFSFLPVMIWAPLMRVDMLAVALSLGGVWCALQCQGRRALASAAMLLFVAAVFTKQTSLAAPIAAAVFMLLVDRRAARAALTVGLTVGGVGLAGLTAVTSGGFLRHIVLYNVNRYSLQTAFGSLAVLWPNTTLVTLGVVGLAVRVPHLTGVGAMRSALATDRDARGTAMLLLYFGAASVSLLAVGKSGGGPNYFIEWMAVLSVLIGTLFGATAAGGGGWLRLAVPAALLAQVFVFAVLPDRLRFDPVREQALEGLVATIRAAHQPVLSDDMVLLMQAGKQVVWEPAIFAELASTGAWDECRIIRMIGAQAFAFVITQGMPGDALFDSRYTPAVQRAIAGAYPVQTEIAGHTVRSPLGAAATGAERMPCESGQAG